MLQQTALNVLFSDLLVVVLVTIEELLFGEKVYVPRTTNLKCQLMQMGTPQCYVSLHLP